MRKLIALFAVAAGIVGIASAGGYDEFVKALKEAKTLKTSYTLQQIGEGPGTYTLSLKKPNLATIETPTEKIVADGKNITHFDKATQTYYKVPETDSDLKALLTGQDLSLWAPFFGAPGIHISEAKDGGTVTRKGVELHVVNLTLDSAGKQKMTVYLSASDNIARQAEFKSHKFGLDSTSILDTKFLVVGGDIKDMAFAFAAPEGSREMSAEEMFGKRWYYDLAEAEAAAARSGKKIFVDFFATWCGPCKMLAHDVLDTEDFTNRASKYFIFCRIDVDAQADIAKQYSIEAMPTQLVLDKTGAVLDKTVGYGGADAFWQFLNKNMGN